MREELKKFWNKYKKYIVIFILMIFVLNFIFVITDWIAGKGFNWKAILYSPVSNEEWLSFIGVFVGGFATFLLFLSAKETLKNERIKFRNENKMKEKELEHEKNKFKYENEMRKKEFELERNKVRYENKLKKLEKEKSIVEEYLNALDIDEVYNLVTLTFGTSFQKDFKSDKEIMKNIISSRIELVKCITLTKIKLNCNTNFKALIRRNSLENEGEDCNKEKSQTLEKNINDKLNYLYAIYIEILEKIFMKIIKAIHTNSLRERNEEIKTIFSIKDSQISSFFSKIYKKYEKKLPNKIKSNLEEDIIKGDYRYPFYICLDLVVDELTEYFEKKEKKVEKKFFKK
ncbi:hypothetical protein LDK12_06375 [Fusobacterium pseudoperiodonticum]|uniref:hypothetical protein n=1 Tax=Fusobacterium pseudoperiodonticum TaxID=2663009 RepID=UPI0030CBFA9E